MPVERTIYVVDDDEAARDGLAFLLRAYGYAVATFASPVTFLGSVVDLPPGCVITDVRMPEMSGIELLEALTGLTGNWPTIVVTGHGDAGVALEALRAGAVDLLEKPYGQEALLSAVRQALATAQEREAARRIEHDRLTGLLETLTPLERDVLDGLTTGCTGNTIAAGGGLTSRAVATLQASVVAKMRANSAAHLVRMLFRLG